MRCNPLTNEPEALQIVHNQLEKQLDEAQKNVKSKLNDIYGGVDEGYEDGNVRSLIKYAAQWASFSDAIDWLNEATHLVKKNLGDIDLILSSLKDRLDWIYGGSTGERHSFGVSPVLNKIYRRYDEISGVIGYNLDYRFERATYGDQFLTSKDQFAYDYLHSYPSGFQYLFFILEDLLAAIRADDEFLCDEDGNVINLKHQRMAEQISNSDLANIRDDINSIITGRTYYGFRETFNIDNIESTKLMWSNGSASWHIASQFYLNNLKNILVRDQLAKSGFMDTNIIIVPYPELIVELILSSLYPLPMYGMSMEGKARKRAQGKIGPLVSDRDAKRLVTGMVVALVTKWIEKNYKPGRVFIPKPTDPQVSWKVTRIWGDLLEAKSQRSEEKFDEALEGLEAEPGVAGQLINWFDSIEL